MTDETNQWLEDLFTQGDARNMTDRQIRIVRAAVEAFSEKGYAATSTSEIAQRAGVAEGTIFRHYKTKKDLLISIVAPVMAKLIAPFVINDFNKVLNTSFDRFEDFLRAVIANRLEFARKNLPMLKILLQEVPFHPELKVQYMNQFADVLVERMRGIVEHYQNLGQIVDMPSVTMMRMMASAVIGFLFTRFILAPDMNWDEAQETENLVRFIMHGFAPDANTDAAHPMNQRLD